MNTMDNTMQAVQKSLNKDSFRLNFLRKAVIGGKVVLTTEHGGWVAISQKDYEDLTTLKIKQGSKLFTELENNGIIITENNIPKIIDNYRKKYNYLYDGTSLHIVIPTLRCNHKCIYCHSSSLTPGAKGVDMDKDTAKKTVDFIFQSPSKQICIEFQGGESLLKFDMIQYITEYSEKLNKKFKKDLSIELVSNLTKMDDDIIKYIIDHNIGLCTSLDGPKYVHDKNRKLLGKGSSYENVVYWIKRIRDHYRYNLGVLMVTTKHSLPYHKEIIDEYLKLGIDIIKIRPTSLLGFAKKIPEKNFHTTEQYLDFWKKSMDYIIEINKKKTFVEKMSYLAIQKLHSIWHKFTDFQSPCGAVISQLAYNHNGDIYTCDEGRNFDLFNLGNVKTHNYKQILTSPQTCSIIASSTNDTLICDACVFKPFCSVCPVCTYSETNTLLSKLPSDIRCKANKLMFEYILTRYIKEPSVRRIFHRWLKFGKD